MGILNLPPDLEYYRVDRYPFAEGIYWGIKVFYDVSFKWAYVSKTGYLILSQEKPIISTVKDYDVNNALLNPNPNEYEILLPQGKTHTYGKLKETHIMERFWEREEYKESMSLQEIVWQ